MSNPFKVGDRVRSDAFGEGIIKDVEILPYKFFAPTGNCCAFKVRFDSGESCYYSLQGSCLGITAIGGSYGGNNIRHIEDKDEDKESVKCDAVNPSHYNVPGVQRPIDVMRKLFSKEQLEGFLWGNIIKYAHRYGRKGSKKDTAGKIEQYAKWLKELGEENEVHN